MRGLKRRRNLVSTLVDKYSHTKTITNDNPQKDDSSTLGVFSSLKSSGIFDKLTTASVNELSKKNEATLNIADTAKLEATKNINVNAASKFTAKLNTEVSSKNDADASGVNIAYGRNYSELNIGGTLKAGGNINIDSTEQTSSGIELLDRLGDFVKSDTYKTISEIYKHFNDAKSTITEIISKTLS